MSIEYEQHQSKLKECLQKAHALVGEKIEIKEKGSIEETLIKRLDNLGIDDVKHDDSKSLFVKQCLDTLLSIQKALLDVCLSSKTTEAETRDINRDVLGVRDLRLVHTLLQVVVSWGLYPCFLPGVGVPLSKRVKSGYINHELLTAAVEHDNDNDKEHSSSSSTPRNTNKQRTLFELVTPLVDIINYSEKVPDSKQYTTVASILLNRHLPDLNAGLLQLAYAPTSAFNKPTISSNIKITEGNTTSNTSNELTNKIPMTPGNMMSIRPVSSNTAPTMSITTPTPKHLTKEERDKCARMFMWLFERSDLVRAMESLMALLGSNSTTDSQSENLTSLPPSAAEPVPNWLRTICGRFLSRILLKPNGVSVILNFTIGDVEQVQLSQLESISKLILSVPQQMKSIESYYAIITPQLLSILQQEPISSPICQAVIFIVGRMIAKYPELAKKYIIDQIVGPLLIPWNHNQPSANETSNNDKDDEDEIKLSETELETLLNILHRILMGGEPGVITQSFLSSSVPVLYHLYQFTCQSKSNLKEPVLDLLTTYFRITTTADAIRELKRILLDPVDVIGTRLAYFAPGPGGGVVMRMRNKPRMLGGNELPLDASIMVDFLQTCENEDLCGDFFVFLLNEYSSLKTRHSNDPRVILMVLHLVMGMLDTLGPTILNKPTQIISFANNVIQDHADKLDTDHKTTKEQHKQKKKVSGFPDMLSNIVSQEDLETIEENHDEQGSLEDDEESLILAINLLRAVMHENDNLNEKAIQLLKSSIEPLKIIEKKHPFELVSEAVNELLLALTSFLSSEAMTNTSGKHNDSSSLEASKEKYKLAMKSLQDDLLPIRAHGMGLLKEMALAKDPLVSTGEGLDQLLDIFTRLVQDEDSYIYLNAVKGLSAMTDAYGNEIIRKLGAIYKDNQQKLDNRLRVGEALLQTIQRAGDALGKYVQTLIDPLETVLERREEDSHLRVSALSILGMACQTSPVALSSQINELIDWVLNILEIERVPEVRRAATVLILSLFRGLASQALYEYPTESLRRTYRTLRYIEETDADELCRYQARVALSDLDTIMRGEIFKHQHASSVRYK